MNCSQDYEATLSRLSKEEAWTLQVLHDLRQASLAEFQDLMYSGTRSRVLRQLQDLQALGLVTRQKGRWFVTWSGSAVANWQLQKLYASALSIASVPWPRSGENGRHLGPPCQEYRETLFAQGYCWCCRERFHHFAEILKFAERVIRSSL